MLQKKDFTSEFGKELWGRHFGFLETPTQQYQTKINITDYPHHFNTQVENAILKYTNIERKKHDLAALNIDPVLSQVARHHSIDMAVNQFFDHTNPKGETPTARAQKKGYEVKKDLGNGCYSTGIGENIAKMPTGNVTNIGFVPNEPDKIAKITVDVLMNSKGHRENILNNNYSVIGIGVERDGVYYLSTQNFK